MIAHPVYDFQSYTTIDRFLDTAPMPARLISEFAKLSYDDAEFCKDSLSKGQLMSKLILVDHISSIIDSGARKVVVCGGWCGVLSAMLLFKYPYIEVTSIDICNRSTELATRLVGCSERFSAVSADMYTYDFGHSDIIINTSTEHIDDIPAWLCTVPRGKIVISQNNNLDSYAGHVSCRSSLIELVNDVCGSGHSLHSAFEIKLPSYSRFTVCSRA